MINRWEERSKDFIGGFLELFGREGKFVCHFLVVDQMNPRIFCRFSESVVERRQNASCARNISNQRI
jgi:hypothetical protein